MCTFLKQAQTLLPVETLACTLDLVGLEAQVATDVDPNKVDAPDPASMGRLAIIKELRKLGVDYSHVKGDIVGLRALIAQQL